MNDIKEKTSGARYLSAVWLMREVIKRGLPTGLGRETAEIREAALHGYEIVLGALESAERAQSISVSGKLPLEKIRPSAKKIVEFLLLDGGSNPFVSLGLSPFATKEDIHRRWKRLINIYHPDRHPGEKDPPSEEAAKKINDSYKKALELKNSKPGKLPVFKEKEKNREKRGAGKTKNWKIQSAGAAPAGMGGGIKLKSLCRPSSIIFFTGSIVMIAAIVSICINAEIKGSTSGLKKALEVKRARGNIAGAPSLPPPDINVKTGGGPVEGGLIETNAPEKTYLLFTLKKKMKKKIKNTSGTGRIKKPGEG